MIHDVSVKTLAEFACKNGKLQPTASSVRMREGREGHAVIQSEMAAKWGIERTVTYDVNIENTVLRIHGRADACRVENDCVSITEIKTTRKDMSDIVENEYPEHWAQAEIYAWILCQLDNCHFSDVHLIYANINGDRKEFSVRFEIQELEQRFMQYAVPYAKFIHSQEVWKEKSISSLHDAVFPFPDMRIGQQEMIDAVYNAMSSGERVLIEAPTGIGKTAASIYGAVKALGKGEITSIFYLTARTTGRQSAEQAVQLMRNCGLKIRSVTITAKEKICLREKKDCGTCPYADGYYSRRRDALKYADEMECLNEERIRSIATEFEICPFEISLDLSETADIVICDYNYVFDPRVYLKRRFDKKTRTGLLIDEAHNLADRARNMCSATLNGETIQRILQKHLSFFGPDDDLSVALNALLTQLKDEEATYEARTYVPEELVKKAEIFAVLAEKLPIYDDELTELAREAAWFVRLAKRFDEGSHRVLIRPCKSPLIEVKLWCFAPEQHLGRLFSKVGGVALFSATLSPMEYYARSLAIDDRKNMLVLDSPFPAENLFTARIPISVKYRDRQDTLEQVARVIHAAMQSHVGNYLVCFPSHAYLEKVYQYYRMRFPEERIIRQQTFMSEMNRRQFISEFKINQTASLAGFIVLGGVFSEGIDLPGELLSGTIILSTGIPQVNPESELLRELNEYGDGEGYDIAYTYPGFQKVLQAAGRVIRTEYDKGIVLLLDSRYSAEKYTELFPTHWRVRKITGMKMLNAYLVRFWKKIHDE